jgi:hypothetical protein
LVVWLATTLVVLGIPLAAGAGPGEGRVSPVVGGEVRLSPAATPGAEQAPDVACDVDADRCLVVWQHDRDDAAGRGTDIYARLVVGTDGRPMAPARRISGPAATGDDLCPAVAWASTNAWGAPHGQYLVVWQDGRNADSDVYGRQVGDDGIPIGGDIRISTTAYDDLCGDVTWASSTNQYFVVWEDRRNPAVRGSDIYGRLLNAWDGALPGAAVRVSGPEATTDDQDPAVAWNNNSNQFLVVWEDQRDYGDRYIDIYGRRVRAAGSMLGLDFRISGPDATYTERDPAVAWGWGQNEFVVVWWDQRGQDGFTDDVFGQRVRADGTLRGVEKRISYTWDGQTPQPAIDWSEDTRQFLVVWQDWRNFDPPADRGADIYGRLLGDDWVFDGPSFRASGVNALESEYNPAVAWNSTAAQFQVVWEDRRANPDDAIFGRRVAG